MKLIFNFVIISIIFPIFSIGQSILLETTYALGEVASLPDTIIILTTNNQPPSGQNYTEIKKIKSDVFRLSYWPMEKGGIIDPTLYKYDLKANLNGPNLIKFHFGKNQKTYNIKQLQKAENSYFILYAVIDSSKFKTFQQNLDGCWKTKPYQFKYSKENNSGVEYKSLVHSSAPIFSLIIKDNDVYIEWMDLTGGGSLQKILFIRKNKVLIENQNGSKVVYKRSKDCNPVESKNTKRDDYNNKLKLRLGVNYNFLMNYVKVEAGLYKNDFPFSLHRKGEWGEIVNHNTFLATEINIYDKFFIGPKLGYEFNYVFLQGRLNLIDYLDFQKNNTFVFRPEFGGTLFGLFSITYGYNFIIYNLDKSLTQPHILSLTYNFH